jgi:Peptidase family S41
MRPSLLLAAASLSIVVTGLGAPQPATAEVTYQPRIISAEDARADVALLRRALETVHPGLYRYSNRQEIDAAFARLDAAASRPITELALHGEVALMLATIHCDHTKPEMSDTLTAYRKANPTHLPFRFKIIEGRMIVISTDGQADAPPSGTEILQINGMPIPTLLLKLAATVAYDGGTDQAIAVKLGDDSDLMGDDFNEYYPSFFGFPSSWRVVWKPIGSPSASETILTPITFDRWTKLEAQGSNYRNEFYKSVTWGLAGKTARLKIDTLVNYRNPVQPTAFLGGFFKAMKDARTERLILDLRNNGGGSDDVSIALGRYLIANPAIWAKPIRYKAIRYGDLAQYISSWGDRDALFNPPVAQFTKTTDGWYDRIPDKTVSELNDDESTIEHLPSPDRFNGQLIILTGPRNGSGTTRTIAWLKERANAQLVGEDSAGSAEGPTAGQVFLMTLPKSGIKARIPNAWNRTNISSWVPNMGVPVDILVTPTLADYQAERDRALDAAGSTTNAASLNPTTTLADALKGRWSGTLDYRDYGNDERVVLPTVLDADGLSLAWTYDDGPGKTVRSTETWSFDATGQTVTIDGGKSQSTYRVSEFRKSADGALTTVLDGTATEKGRSVMSRTILTLSKGTLRITQLSRTPRTPFLMRHSYELRQKREEDADHQTLRPGNG